MDGDRLAIRLVTSRLVFLRPGVDGKDLLASVRQSETDLLLTLRAARSDAGVELQLRQVYRAVVPDGRGDAPFDEMAKQLAAAVASGRVRAFLVADVPAAAAAGAGVGAVAGGAADTPVAFVDDTGAPVRDPAGTPMQRPAGLDPHVIAGQGVADRKAEEAMILSGDSMAAAGYQLGALAKFKQGGPWDAQRIGGKFHPEFVDYATVLIGLYAAATGMAKSAILSIENDYAWARSHYPPATVMDSTYTHLPARNVANTTTGYQLFANGRIRPTP